MSGHTPGPWVDRGSTRPIEVEAAMQELAGEHVSPIFANAVEDGEYGDVVAFVRSDEDARLIAAAPDLLEAVKDAMSFSAEALELLAGDDGRHLGPRRQRWADAIAKAEGGDS